MKSRPDVIGKPTEDGAVADLLHYAYRVHFAPEIARRKKVGTLPADARFVRHQPKWDFCIPILSHTLGSLVEVLVPFFPSQDRFLLQLSPAVEDSLPSFEVYIVGGHVA
jgi:hypothetical protein